MNNTEREVNSVFNIAVYIKLMASFIPDADFEQVSKMVGDIHDFFKFSEKEEVLEKLPYIKSNLEQMAAPLLTRFPIRKSLDDIVADWDQFFKDDSEIYSYGLEYGWLEERMDIQGFIPYNHIPYHFRLGLYANMGNFGIEEEFLIKDSFNILVKAQKSFDQLKEYGDYKQKVLTEEGKKDFDQETVRKITDLKYEISANSRLAIISFYAFVESFVNSLGYSHAKRNEGILTENDFEILNGKKNSRFLQLKSKIERYQPLIRDDGKTIIVTSDDNQIKEPFISFFNIYENLRNSAVHFSPTKEPIWLKPADWIEKAEHFSKLSLQVALEIWKSCYPILASPDYIGRLDYDIFMDKAKLYIRNLEEISDEMNSCS
ncbi:hypothetical protein ACN9MN_04630 [Chryseobacterium sp. S-02]|uniref:hypothetical protein n=1 Tax=Chryseobacterium sp. S-02 TaxID=3404064 RepID=UPI003CF11FEB